MNGLVLEGGAMRGMFTAGVLDYLMEQDLVFDGIIGVSAGACFGANYKSHQIGRTLRYNIKYSKDKRYCSMDSLIRTGNIFNARFCFHDVPEELDVFDRAVYEDDPAKFYVAASDIKSGEPAYKLLNYMDRTDLEWVRASSSMPFFAEIVHLEGMSLLDGGLTDPIPLRFMKQKGYDKNVVVLTKPLDFRKNKNNLKPLIKMKYRKYPVLVKLLEKNYAIYNREKDYIEKELELGNIFLIAPDSPLPLGHICHDEDLIQKAYDIGYDKAAQVFEDLDYYLNGAD
ncbi:MAG: patatin family protein [Lachnospiraceae bacterium]|nr:patatin family protein [Lachnospiraceae bacterium]